MKRTPDEGREEGKLEEKEERDRDEEEIGREEADVGKGVEEWGGEGGEQRRGDADLGDGVEGGDEGGGECDGDGDDGGVTHRAAVAAAFVRVFRLLDRHLSGRGRNVSVRTLEGCNSSIFPKSSKFCSIAS